MHAYVLHVTLCGTRGVDEQGKEHAGQSTRCGEGDDLIVSMADLYRTFSALEIHKEVTHPTEHDPTKHLVIQRSPSRRRDTHTRRGTANRHGGTCRDTHLRSKQSRNGSTERNGDGPRRRVHGESVAHH